MTDSRHLETHGDNAKARPAPIEDNLSQFRTGLVIGYGDQNTTAERDRRIDGLVNTAQEYLKGRASASQVLTWEAI